MTKDTIVITHANCTDGFTAACVLAQVFEDRADYLSMAYYEMPPDCTGKHVIIADFSFSRHVMEKIQAQSKSMKWFDHHQTAIDRMRNFPWRFQDVAITDNSRSGAGIVADAYQRRTRFVSLVEDYDLWAFKHEDSIPLHMYLRTVPQVMKDWRAVMDACYDPLELKARVEIGKLVYNYHMTVVEKSVQSAYPCTLRDANGILHSGLAANCPGAFASEVGNALSKLHKTNTGYSGFGLAWCRDRDKVYVSLRSATADVNVAHIAEAHDGGGHALSSGFTLGVKDERIAALLT